MVQARVSIAGHADIVTDNKGHFFIEGLKPGVYELAIEAQGYEKTVRTIELQIGKTSSLTVGLVVKLPTAQLRGLVRSYAGDALFATISIVPGTLELQTNETGAFETDIEPGVYDVSIKCEGYLKQTRRIKVEEGGVTILNIDMRKGARTRSKHGQN
ncbi:MAG: carboxypeptidase regulatory-like domain-containing protein [Myxococcales bacterium]|nr:MAG: carboxypeptidase regulatory-like domain-containing protein [Myxococcales bacterium]